MTINQNSLNQTLPNPLPKGAIPVGNGTQNVGSIPVGSTGQVLTYNSSATNGVNWASPTAAAASVIPNYYQTAIPKWVNSNQTALNNYYVTDDTNAVTISKQSASTFDITKLNVDGGITTSQTLPGTLTVTKNNISGTGTTFTTSFAVGDTIYLPSYGISRKIIQIFNDREMVTDTGENFFFNDWYLSAGAPVISTAQSKFGGSSLYVNGSSSVDMTVYGPISGLHQFEFTVEANFYFSSLSTSNIQSIMNGQLNYQYSVYVNTSGKLFIDLSYAGTSWDIANTLTGTTTLVTGQWYHIALTYYYGVYTLWLNGKAEITLSSTTSLIFTALNQFRLGACEGTIQYYMTGYIDEARLSSCCRYYSTFTPPTSALSVDSQTLALNHFDGTNNSNNFNVSEVIRPTPVRWDASVYGNPTISSGNSKFGGYSLALGPAIGVNLNTGLSSGNMPTSHTMEFWVNFTTLPASGTYWAVFSGNSNGFYYNVNLNGPKLAFTLSNNGTSANVASATGTTTLATNTWYHYALTYDASTYRQFVNGAVDATAASTTAVTNNWAKQITIGAYSSAQTGMNGYVDELRFSNLARYTAAFTAPTSAFTVDANTIALNHFDAPNTGSTFIQDGEQVGGTTYQRGGYARSTHFYPYAVSNGVGTQLMLSHKCKSYGETPDLPSGFTYIKQLRFVITTNANGNVSLFSINNGFVTFVYNDDTGTPIGFNGQYAIGGGLGATSFSTLGVSTYVPKISQEALICSYIWNNTTTDSAVRVRYTGSISPNGVTVAQATNQYINGSVTKTTAHVNDTYISLNSLQQFDYKVTTSGCACGFHLKGYKITEI